MSTIKLSHNTIQTKGMNCINESELIITVEYNTEERSVEGVVSVESYNWITKTKTNLTHIFGEVFDDALGSMVDQIKWDEEYLAYLQSSPKLFEEEAA